MPKPAEDMQIPARTKPAGDMPPLPGVVPRPVGDMKSPAGAMPRPAGDIHKPSEEKHGGEFGHHMHSSVCTILLKGTVYRDFSSVILPQSIPQLIRPSVSERVRIRQIQQKVRKLHEEIGSFIKLRSQRCRDCKIRLGLILV
jgi:hypothetical protein